ncbi:hypothetical protein [Pelagerythrobacter sp.]|uniref:hypothetical protein n=1 Tax=Pelagerythrobacter sp. TaxID=2800702 RepID=UPI0035AFBCB4
MKASPPRRDVRVLAALWLLGMAGVASLLAVPLELALPAGMDVPRWALLINPALFVAVAVPLGWWAAPRAGLSTPILAAMVHGKLPAFAWRAALPPILAVVAATAAILLAYGHATRAVFSAAPDIAMPLIARVLYGGIAEEIIVRWGVLSTAIIALLSLRTTRAVAFWSANATAALLFAIGHFGMLFMLVPDPPMWLIAAVLAGNVLPGLGFGWLFARHGLEAAMLAHAGSHVLFVLVAPLVALSP